MQVKFIMYRNKDVCMYVFLIVKYVYISDIEASQHSGNRPVARGGQGGQLTPPLPLENQRSTFWNLAHEIIKANNYKWLTIYLKFVLLFWPWVSLPSLAKSP